MRHVQTARRIAEVGQQRAVAGGPSGAGQRGPTLGGHGGAHHGGEGQGPARGGQPEDDRGRCRAGGRQRPLDQNRITENRRRAVPRCSATDQGLLLSRTVTPPRPPCTSRSARSSPPALAGPAPAHGCGTPPTQDQDERPQEDAGDQAVHPLEHDLPVGVAEVRDGREMARQRQPDAVAGGPVGAGEPRIRGADQGAQDDQDEGEPGRRGSQMTQEPKATIPRMASD